MCERGTMTPVWVADGLLGKDGGGRRVSGFVGIDECIADLVAALNAAGFRTIASCCGHHRCPGSIILDDGRELVVMPNYGAARDLARRMDWHLLDYDDPARYPENAELVKAHEEAEEVDR